MGKNLPSQGTPVQTLSACRHAPSSQRRKYKSRYFRLRYGEDEERKGWEMLRLDGQTVGIRTSATAEKSLVFETLVISCSTLQARCES